MPIFEYGDRRDVCPTNWKISHVEKFLLAFSPGGSKKDAFFESANHVFALYRNPMSGNPVKIGDGCATVTGYKLPMPLIAIRSGRRERG